MKRRKKLKISIKPFLIPKKKRYIYIKNQKKKKIKQPKKFFNF